MRTEDWRNQGHRLLTHGARVLRRRWRRVLLIAAGSVFFALFF